MATVPLTSGGSTTIDRRCAELNEPWVDMRASAARPGRRPPRSVANLGPVGLLLFLLLWATLGCGGVASHSPESVGGAGGANGEALVKQVSVGMSYSCALLVDGTAKCWGYNSNGQLGIDPGCQTVVDCTAFWSITPVTVQDLHDAVQIKAGYLRTCAALADGTASCWGHAAQLDNGARTDSAWPIMVQGLTNVSAVTESCALLGDGTVSHWGGEQPPAVVEGLSNVDEIAGGVGHTCARVRGGTVWCWGDNNRGQLGDGTAVYRSEPVMVQGLSAVQAVSATDFYSCALLEGGTVKCWGENTYGQLGDGTTIDRSVPVDVQGLSNVAGISAGRETTCALLFDGTVACWGKSVGQNDLTPVSVPGVTGAVMVAAGDGHACALLRDGTVKCWGNNVYGQLGDGTRTSSSLPVTVTELP